MAMTINTNVVSINSQRNLSLSGNSLATAMQRLSSGLRVNSAKDDAAGLAIAERMNAQAKGLAVAARNANDGISLAQTAEGALGKVGDMLQRMRELAVQSANATNSTTDRAALQAEVKQMANEIDRVAKTSEFNGTKLLNGTFAGAVFQVGAAAGDNITVGALANATAATLGKAFVYTATDSNAGSTLIVAADAAKVLNDAAVGTSATSYVVADGANWKVVTYTEGGTTASNVGALDISTQGGAWVAMKVIDKALDEVNSSRGALGALQTRFEKTVENIDIMNENISAARGRIVDADFAAETANLSRTQILQQAGTAMVAQANQLPQNVLSLLR